MKLSNPINCIPFIPSRKFQFVKLITREKSMGPIIRMKNPSKLGRINNQPESVSV